jgi:hypothetical protein
VRARSRLWAQGWVFDPVELMTAAGGSGPSSDPRPMAWPDERERDTQQRCGGPIDQSIALLYRVYARVPGVCECKSVPSMRRLKRVEGGKSPRLKHTGRSRCKTTLTRLCERTKRDVGRLRLFVAPSYSPSSLCARATHTHDAHKTHSPPLQYSESRGRDRARTSMVQS